MPYFFFGVLGWLAFQDQYTSLVLWQSAWLVVPALALWAKKSPVVQMLKTLVNAVVAMHLGRESVLALQPQWLVAAELAARPGLCANSRKLKGAA